MVCGGRRHSSSHRKEYRSLVIGQAYSGRTGRTSGLPSVGVELITATQGYTSLVLEAHWFTQSGGITEVITQPDGSTYTLHHTMTDVRYGESINTATASIFGTYAVQFVDDTTGKKSNMVKLEVENNTVTPMVTYDYPEVLPTTPFNLLIHQVAKNTGMESPIMYNYPNGGYTIAVLEFLIAEAKHSGWKYEILLVGQ